MENWINCRKKLKIGDISINSISEERGKAAKWQSGKAAKRQSTQPNIARDNYKANDLAYFANRYNNV